MNRKERIFIRLFIIVIFFFSLFLCAWVPIRADLDFRLEDTEISLDTSRGRERKQTLEYEQVQSELPVIRAELAVMQPKADASAERLRALKETRKVLRAEKKALEEAAKVNTGASSDPESPSEEELP